MTPSFRRIAPPLIVLLLGCASVSSANAGWLDFGSDSKPAAAKPAADQTPAAAKPAADLDGQVRQAQMMRQAGNYNEAVHSLSQMMLVASDDPRVVSEYGKTLAAMGRASDAVQFLTRATQLAPTDWSVYSALGVAYDQLGKQTDAEAAYERALTIRPGEPSVLNNYALSRMLAHDPDIPDKLAGRAQVAGGGSDPKIARNIAMINDLAPAIATGDKPFEIAKPGPAPAGAVVKAMPMPPLTAAPVSAPLQPNAAPRQLVPPADAPLQAQPRTASASQPATPGVVMQAVPFDPYAGPVKSQHPSKGFASVQHAPAKAAKLETKPAAPKVAETAAAKAQPAAMKTTKKDGGVPALRLSANAY